MNSNHFNKGILLRNVTLTNDFLGNLVQLVRKNVIPYQWDALNDNIEGAEPSSCMRNFKVAGELKKKRQQNIPNKESIFPIEIFNPRPENETSLENRFYGFVFQDTDFSKWIEAVGYQLAMKPDSQLEQLADKAIEIVCDAAMEDGYLDTCYIINNPSKRFTNLRDHHELYCLGHLIEGAIAYYEATGKTKLLNAAQKFADCACNHFGPQDGKCKGYPGHEIVEMALVKLYEITEEKRYLDLASFFVSQRGTLPNYFSQEHNTNGDVSEFMYHQAHKPVLEQSEAVGHAVRAVYLYTGMAEIAKYTKDDKLYQVCCNLFDNISKQKMYITGGIGASPDGEAFSYNYNLPNDKMYNETCASIGLMFFARKMLEIEPDSYYADVMEKAFYNGVLSGMSLDGKSFFYVNPLEVVPEGCQKDSQRKQVALPRQKWFGCACCPPNLARLISSIASYAFSENENSLLIHLFIGGTIKKSIHGNEVELKVKTSYPWEDTVEITIHTKQPLPFHLKIRTPGWCKDPSIAINRGFVNPEVTRGYADLYQVWSEGDTVLVRLPMQPVFYQADTRVRDDIGKVALMRGPIVYCAEEADNGNELHLLEVDVKGEVEIKLTNDELGNIVRLSACGRKIVTKNNQNLYEPFTGYQYEPVKLNYIPYYTWCNRGVGEMITYLRWYENNL